MNEPPAPAQKRRGARRVRAGVFPKKLSRLHRPQELSLEAWQRALRRQFGREQTFLLKNRGDHPVF